MATKKPNADTPSDKELLATAFQEMNLGLPAGELLSRFAPQPVPLETPATPEPQGDWASALQRLTMGAAPAPAPSAQMDSAEMFQQIQDQAATDQDRLMGQMFGEGMAPRDRRSEPNIPPAVDRYLERLLS